MLMICPFQAEKKKKVVDFLHGIYLVNKNSILFLYSWEDQNVDHRIFCSYSTPEIYGNCSARSCNQRLKNMMCINSEDICI